MKKNDIKQKVICPSFTISQNELLGRYLIAAKDIKQGEILFQEKPLVFGPTDNNIAICFSCGGIPVSNCKHCQIAITCGSECPGKAHSNVECNFYRKISKKLKCTNFMSSNLVLPLRCLLNLKNPEGGWLNFFTLESHKEKRRGTTVWKHHQQNIIEVLQKWEVIARDNKDEEFVQEIMGILDVNTFEVRCGYQIPGRALYLQASLMAHDCFPNIIIAVDKSLIMTVKARRDINAGQPITHNYTNTLYGTIIRREHLMETKYFSCNCVRCNDPTELGTHLNSLLCPRCHTGYIVYNKQKNSWSCIQCSHKFHTGLINATLNHIQNLIEDLDKNNIKDIECILKRLLKTLACNHSFIIDLKQQLAVLYRNEEPTVDLLNKRKTVCEELLTVIRTLEPGISRLQGIALYELHGVLLDMAQIKNNDLHLLQEAEHTLKESVSLLLHEPLNSPEGDLVRQLMSELKFIREAIPKFAKKKSKKKK